MKRTYQPTLDSFLNKKQDEPKKRLAIRREFAEKSKTIQLCDDNIYQQLPTEVLRHILDFYELPFAKHAHELCYDYFFHNTLLSPKIKYKKQSFAIRLLHGYFTASEDRRILLVFPNISHYREDGVDYAQQTYVPREQGDFTIEHYIPSNVRSFKTNHFQTRSFPNLPQLYALKTSTFSYYSNTPLSSKLITRLPERQSTLLAGDDLVQQSAHSIKLTTYYCIYNVYTSTIDTYEHLLPKLINVVTLDLTNTQGITDRHWDIFSKLSKLRNLILTGTKCELKITHDGLVLNANLKKLCIEKIVVDKTKDMSKTRTQHNLEELYVNKGQEGIQMLMDSGIIRSLSTYGNQLSLITLDSIYKQGNLHNLCIWDLSEETSQSLFKAGSQLFNSLRRVELVPTVITEGMIAIIVKSSPYLTELIIVGAHGKATLQDAEAINQHSMLTSLALISCRVDNLVAEKLFMNTKLSTLDLSINKVGDECLHNAFVNWSITDLSLRDCYFTQYGLVELVNKNKMVQFLDLGDLHCEQIFFDALLENRTLCGIKCQGDETVQVGPIVLQLRAQTNMYNIEIKSNYNPRNDEHFETLYKDKLKQHMNENGRISF